MQDGPRIITIEGLRRLGITYHQGYLLALEKRGLFPSRVYLSKVKVGWVLPEVEQWLKKRVDARPP